MSEQTVSDFQPGGSRTVVAFDPKARKVVKDPIAERALKTMYGRKARMLRKRFDRMATPLGQRTVQVSPKMYAEAQRIGLTHIEGLRVVL